MIKEFVKQWDARKHLLEEWLKENQPSDYDDIYKKLFELVITEPLDKYADCWGWDRFTVIDDGHYQGNRIFILCNDRYQPDLTDYIFTEVDYGSCSGCDTFEHIRYLAGWDSKKNTEEQVDQYMTLALHMVQETKTFNQQDQ
jgi:hypothetical protein